MDFSFTDDQRMLRDTARRFLTDGTRHDWRSLRRLGWLDADLGPVGVAILAEEHGRHGGPDQWLITRAFGTPALTAAGRKAEQPTGLAWVDEGVPADAPTTCRARHVGTAARLDGVKVRVPTTAGVATYLVLAQGPHGTGLYLTSAPPAAAEERTVDGSRPFAVLRLADHPAEPVLFGTDLERVLWEGRLHASTVFAAESVGVGSAALDDAVRHARERVQFGRTIGSFQAVSHRLVDVYAALELARSLVYRAAWCLDVAGTGDADGHLAGAEEAVTAAAVAANDAAVSACEVAIQTFGAAGFTWNHPMNRRYRRVLWNSTVDGTQTGRRAALAAALLDR